MILIFQMFINVNKLCLNQIKPLLKEMSFQSVIVTKTKQLTAIQQQQADTQNIKISSQRCISKTKGQEEVSWMLHASWSGRLLACLTGSRRDGQFDRLECCWKGGLVTSVTSSGIGARCSYSIFWHLFNLLLPPDNDERRKIFYENHKTES